MILIQLQENSVLSVSLIWWKHDIFLNLFFLKLRTGDLILIRDFGSFKNYWSSTCANGCLNDYFCIFFDYDCETGDCIFFNDFNNGCHGADNVFAENGHISGMYKNRAKK